MKTNVQNRSVVIGLTVGLLLTPAAALAQVSVGTDLGTSMRDVLIGLEDKGYTVIDLELKRDRIEAEAMFDSREYEIDVDITTGKVTKVELD